MKSFKYILLSYFQQHVFGTLGMIFSILFFIAGNGYAFSNGLADGHAMELFYYAIIALTLIMSQHLKRMIMSNTSALLPNYRKDNFIVTGVLLILFIVWPLLLLLPSSANILPWLTIFLFTSAVILWIVFRFSDQLPIFLILLWVIRLSYELLDLPVSHRFISIIHIDIVPYSTFLLCTSFILYYLFIRDYFNLSILDYEDCERDETDPWARDYDKNGQITLGLIQNALRKMKIRNGGKKTNWSVLYQIALFSPVQSTAISSVGIITALVFIISAIFIIYPHAERVITDIYPILIFIYYISATIQTTDFLQHRERLAMLWIVSPTSSRKDFVHHTTKAYLTVILRNYIMESLFFTVILYFFTNTLLQDLILVLLLGLLLKLFHVALSLIFSDIILSPEAKGWTFFNTLIAVILLGVLLKGWHSINVIYILPLFFVTVVLCIGGIYKLFQMDLDYTSPRV